MGSKGALGRRSGVKARARLGGYRSTFNRYSPLPLATITRCPSG